jgi:hypothetical protein
LERFVDTFQRLKEEKDDVIDKTAAILRELRTKVKQTIETKTDELVQQKATFTDKVKEQWARLTASLKSGSSNTPKRQKKIKLVLLGDSLVCGVGCDDGIVERSSSSSSTSSSSSSSSQPLTLSGPVLPQIVAKVLSAAMRVDVEWSSIGIVGGTVNDVRNVLLPEMRQKLRGTPVSRKGDTSAVVESVASSSSSSSSGSRHESTASGGEEATVGTTTVAASSSSGSGGNGVTRSGYAGPVGNEDEEVFFVVICGVNDLKRTYSQFPNCGPAAFKEQLGKLVVDIQEMGQELRMNCKVFLPAIPVVCGRGDATSPLMVLRPLSTFVEYLGYIWDAQKKAVAIDNEVRFSATLFLFSFFALFNTFFNSRPLPAAGHHDLHRRAVPRQALRHPGPRQLLLGRLPPVAAGVQVVGFPHRRGA